MFAKLKQKTLDDKAKSPAPGAASKAPKSESEDKVIMLIESVMPIYCLVLIVS